MPEVTSDLVFDPTALATHEDPYPLYDRLRQESPVFYSEKNDFYALSRFEDVMAAEDDWQGLTGRYGVDIDDTSNLFGDGVPVLGFFLGYDPPRHSHIRKALQPAFMPSGLKQFEPMIREKCETLVANFIERGNADIAEEFAIPFPDLVFAEIIGFHRDKHPMLSRLLRTALIRDIINLPQPFIPEAGLRASTELRKELKDIVEERRRHEPVDDLLGHLINAEVEGKPMPAEEIVGTVFFVFTAGTEEVSGVITNALRLLGQHPDQRTTLLENPGAIPAALEEILRYETVVQHLIKTSRREMELHGQKIAEGSRVMLIYGAANRDEAEFPDGNRFDVTRSIKRLASFGGGIHTCLGRPLARLEAKIALETLLPRMADYDFAAPYEWAQRVNFRGLRRLPLAWTPQG